MIQIDNDDTPIEVATKLIKERVECEGTVLSKTLYKGLYGEEPKPYYMPVFTLLELKEIAEHLLVYVNCNLMDEEEEEQS